LQLKIQLDNRYQQKSISIMDLVSVLYKFDDPNLYEVLFCFSHWAVIGIIYCLYFCSHHVHLSLFCNMLQLYALVPLPFDTINT